MADQMVKVSVEWMQRIEEKLDEALAMGKGPEDFGQTMDVQEAAAYLQVDVNTIYRWARSGKLPHNKVGRRYFFYKTELKDWMREVKP